MLSFIMANDFLKYGLTMALLGGCLYMYLQLRKRQRAKKAAAEIKDLATSAAEKKTHDFDIDGSVQVLKELVARGKPGVTWNDFLDTLKENAPESPKVVAEEPVAEVEEDVTDEKQKEQDVVINFKPAKKSS